MDHPYKIVAAIAGALTVAAASVAPAAPNMTTLVAFSPANEGAFNPYGGLVADAAGNLYGTTFHGGTVNATCTNKSCGAVFELVPGTPWQKNIIWSFSGADGGNPFAGLSLGSGGALYGTTLNGGAANAGTVFSLTPPAAGTSVWTHTVLWSFTGAGDGGHPYAGLIADSSGALYGTTYKGGASNLGTVFKLAPPLSGTGPWIETVLRSFAGGTSDGSYPVGGLVADSSGNLYGTAAASTTGFGIAFRLKPPAAGNNTWTETVLYSWANESLGAHPRASLILDKSGNLYGTTSQGGYWGGGVAFELTPAAGGATPWNISVLWAAPLGSGLDTGLVPDTNGNLYGAVNGGGTTRPGSIFELTPPATAHGKWVETDLLSFTKANGYQPNAPLIIDASGALYGTTIKGGPAKGGTVFKLTP